MRVCVSIVAFAMASALLGACESTATDGETLCTAFCSCETSLPSARQICVDRCVPNVPVTLPDGCVECVLTASCAQNEQGACDDVCTSDEPPSRQAPTPTEETP